MRVPIGYQFPVQLRNSGTASFPSFDEVGQMGINAGGSRARLLFGKRAIAQPARNGCVTDPYMFSDGGLREPLLAEGYHVLVLSLALLPFCLTERNTLWKHFRWFPRR